MRTEIIEETKSMDPQCVGEAYVYHYIEYRFMRLPKEVRVTTYKGGPLDGQTEEVTIYHKDKRFADHVEPKLPHKKQLIKIPLKDIDFKAMYNQSVKKVTETEDPCLKKYSVPKDVCDNLALMNIIQHYNDIDKQYRELKPKK